VWRFSAHRWFEAEAQQGPSPDQPDYFDRLEHETKERFAQARILARMEDELVEGQFELTEESAYRLFKG
jgi:hypothetical protein